MKFAPILTLLVLAGCNVKLETEQSARLDYLENRMAYVYEVIQARRLSVEHCESYSDDGMVCALGENLRCGCTRLPDKWDIANDEFNTAVAAKAQELLAAHEAEAARPAELVDEDDDE